METKGRASGGMDLASTVHSTHDHFNCQCFLRHFLSLGKNSNHIGTTKLETEGSIHIILSYRLESLHSLLLRALLPLQLKIHKKLKSITLHMLFIVIYYYFGLGSTGIKSINCVVVGYITKYSK